MPRPRITNFRGEDFGDTGRLMELHRQAVEAGYPVKGESGRREFFALAERARRHGNNAPRLFAWLLREGRFDFITQGEEEVAIARIKHHQGRDRPRPRKSESSAAARGITHNFRGFREELGADERVVEACIVAGRRHKIDPFRIAQSQGWTRDRWNEALMAYEHAEKQRWHAPEIEEASGDSGGGGGFLHLMDEQQS